MMENKYKNVCGSAFEDLSHDEMMEYNGGGAFTPALSTTTWACVGASAIISGGLAVSAWAASKATKKKKKK